MDSGRGQTATQTHRTPKTGDSRRISTLNSSTKYQLRSFEAQTTRLSGCQTLLGARKADECARYNECGRKIASLLLAGRSMERDVDNGLEVDGLPVTRGRFKFPLFEGVHQYHAPAGCCPRSRSAGSRRRESLPLRSAPQPLWTDTSDPLCAPARERRRFPRG